MKKVLLILFVLAICVLAFPHGVMAADIKNPDPVLVTANVDQTITCGAAGPALLTLSRGENIVPAQFTLTVTSTNNWQLTAEDNLGGEGAGYMVPESGHFPTAAIALLSPFSIENSASGYSALTSSVEVATGGHGDTPEFTKGLSQPISNDDYSLTTGNYEITIKFTCMNTDVS